MYIHFYTKDPFSIVKECDDLGCNYSINFEVLISGVWPVLSRVMKIYASDSRIMEQTRNLYTKCSELVFFL